VIALRYLVNLLLLGLAGAERGGAWPGCSASRWRHSSPAITLRLIAGRDPVACFRAFRHNVWYGAAVSAGIAADYLLTPSPP
jgi:4-hydroxybenzoate polyprenyltransferase